MKYTILEILPGQLKVEYEDNSWALVPVEPNATLEDIDHAVSQYDPDFLRPAESVINPEIRIGEQRFSSRKVKNSQQEIEANEEDLPLEIQKIREELATQIPDPSPVTTNFNPVMPSIRFGRYQSGDIMAIAEYYAINGDTRLKDKIMEITGNYIAQYSLNIDDIITTLDYTYDPLDDIVAQAEAELNQNV